MISQSAIQVISPAIERTKQFLFRPFRLWRFLKLALVAALVEGAGSGFNFPSGPGSGSGSSSSSGSGHPFHFPHLPQHHIPWPPLPFWIAIGAVVVLVAILIGYLLIRLRFSYFDCVLRQQDRIGDAWSRFHSQAMRYLGLSVGIAVGFWIVLIPIGLHLYTRFKPLFDSIGSDHPPDLFSFFPLLAIVSLIALVLGLGTLVIHVAMGCFVLPRMALEDASIGDALSDVWSDVRFEPGQFALFLLFRVLLSITASILGAIVLIIPLVVVVLVGVVVVLILKAVSTTLALVLGIPLGVLAVILFFLAGIGVVGTIGTFQRNYALLFYGGRYPQLGAILQPPLPPGFVPPKFAPPGFAPSGFVPPNPAPDAQP